MMISLILPAYNEEDCIRSTLDSVAEYIAGNEHEFQVIFVDDGSRDLTKSIAMEYADRIKVISNHFNKGKGSAVRLGVQEAAGEYVFFTDADLSYSLSDIDRAIERFAECGADMVIGERYDKKHTYPVYRKFMSAVLNGFLKCFLGLDTRDAQCGFKGFKISVAKEMFKYNTIDGFGFDFELLHIAKKWGKKIEVLDVELNHKSKSGLNIIVDSCKMFADIFKVKFFDFKGVYNNQ